VQAQTGRQSTHVRGPGKMSGHTHVLASDSQQALNDFDEKIENVRSRLEDVKQRIIRFDKLLSLYDSTTLKPKEDWTTFFAISSDKIIWRPMTQSFGPYRTRLSEEEDDDAVEDIHDGVRQDANDPISQVGRRLAMEMLPSVELLSLQLSKYSLAYNSSTVLPKCVRQEAFGREVSEVKRRLLDLEERLQSAVTFEWIKCKLLIKLVDAVSFKSEVATNEAYAIGLELIDVALDKAMLATRGRRRPRDHDYSGDEDAVDAKRQRVKTNTEEDTSMMYLHVTNVPTELFNVKHFANHFQSKLVTFEVSTVLETQ
jgi:hypothetical protein